MMHKNIIPTLIFLLIQSCAFSQKVSFLNGYSHFTIIPITYNDGSIDIYKLLPVLKNTLSEKGLQFLDYQDAIIPQEIKSNPCLMVTCEMEQTAHSNQLALDSDIILKYRNCKGEVVYTSRAKGNAIYWSFKEYFHKALKKNLAEVRSFKYQFDSSLTPEISLPEVEKIDENEESLISYYNSNTIDELEGIYKSYQSQQLGYYKIAIKKYGNKYKAIIIESDINHWKQGEVKAVFETSSMKGFYSTKWYMANKIPFETFALMENPALLTVEFKNTKTGEKRTDKFIKMYPSIDLSPSTAIDGLKASGSGFVISTDGVIATNAHVIEDADRIEIKLNNEFGTKTYSASVLLKDESNDVALLKIDDDEFKGFNSLPYSILQTTDIGEDVFTIGYPLNSLMGDNYKVTNGIISSNSGLKDDVRFIQITTPIQPGNSGGPLFNKDGNVVGLTTSKLNERAVGTSIENVNYAIKAIYLINIYNMLPNKEQLSKNSTLSDKDLKFQVKVLKNYVCLIKIY